MFSWRLWFGRDDTGPSRKFALGPAAKFSLAVAVGVPFICALCTLLGVVSGPFTSGLGAPLICVLISFYVSGYWVGRLSGSIFSGREQTAHPKLSAYYCLFCALNFPQDKDADLFAVFVLLLFFATPAAVVLYPTAALVGVYLMIPQLSPLDAHGLLMIAVKLLGFFLAFMAVQRGLSDKPLLYLCA